MLKAKLLFRVFLVVGVFVLLAIGARDVTACGGICWPWRRPHKKINLQIDSEAHYNGMVCAKKHNKYRWRLLDGTWGEECVGSWEATDLGKKHKFFKLEDVKPGDYGENTISLHMRQGEGWGKVRFKAYDDEDVSCTEPEQLAEAGNCAPGNKGEIWDNLKWEAWLDQGKVAGFQGKRRDRWEGDNVWQPEWEPRREVVLTDWEPGADEHEWDLTDWLGKMKEGKTYYIGVGWSLPFGVANEAQTDKISIDIAFEVRQ